MRNASQLLEGWRRRSGTAENREIGAASRAGCESTEMHTARTSSAPTKDREKTKRRIPPLCSTTGVLAVCWPFSLPVVVATCCEPRESADSMSRCVAPVSFIDEEANRYRWIRIRRAANNKFGYGPLALPPFCPARHELGEDNRGVGRDRSRAGKGNETQRSVGSRTAGWSGASVSTIPCVRLATAATASTVFCIHAPTAACADEWRFPATMSGAARSVQQLAGAAGEKETVGIRVRSLLD